MKTTVRFTFLFLLLIILISSCEKDKPNCIEEDQVSYHNIEQKYKDLVPFGQPGFSMELTDSASGQKVKFTFNGIDSGYWEDKIHNGNPNCGWFYANNYQYYNYNCVSSNDSLLKLGASLHNLWEDLTGVSMNLQPNVGLLKLDDYYYPFYPERSVNTIHPTFIHKITLNGISYDSVLIINRNWTDSKNQIFYNFKKGIVVLRTKNQLWQQKN